MPGANLLLANYGSLSYLHPEKKRPTRLAWEGKLGHTGLVKNFFSPQNASRHEQI